VGQSLRDDAPIFVMDVTAGAPEYGRKHLVWAETDLNAGYLLPSEGTAHVDPTKAKRPALIIRPAQNLLEGHRYAVVLRHLQRDDGTIIPANTAFAACLDEDFESALPPVAARCAHLRDNVFPALEDAGVDLDPATLFLAWDFTVASTRNNVSRLKHMRDDAFASLGDTTRLAAGDPGFPAGRAPTFTIGSVVDNPSGTIARHASSPGCLPSLSPHPFWPRLPNVRPMAATPDRCAPLQSMAPAPSTRFSVCSSAVAIPRLVQPLPWEVWAMPR
jgi:hypothetical protein